MRAKPAVRGPVGCGGGASGLGAPWAVVWGTAQPRLGHGCSHTGAGTVAVCAATGTHTPCTPTPVALAPETRAVLRALALCDLASGCSQAREQI